MKLAIKIAWLIIFEKWHRWFYDEWYVHKESENWGNCERKRNPNVAWIKKQIASPLYWKVRNDQWRSKWHLASEYFEKKKHRYADNREFYQVDL